MSEVKIDKKDITGLLGEKITVCILQLKSPFDDECTSQSVHGFNILTWNPNELQKRKRKILSLLDLVKNCREDVNIIVFPEYSIHYEMVEDLQDFANSKSVILIGTYYDDRRTIENKENINFRKNMCSVILPNGTREEFVKLEKTSFEADFLEDPEDNEKRILRFYWCVNGHKLCLQIFICGDFFNLDRIDREHGGIVIVPACSPKIEDFKAFSMTCIRPHGKSKVARCVFVCNAVNLPEQQTEASIIGNSQIFGSYQGNLPVLGTDVEGGIIASVNAQNIITKPTTLPSKHNIVIENPISFFIQERNGNWYAVDVRAMEKKLDEEKLETQRRDIHFFETIEEKIDDKTFPTKEDLNNDLIYLDEKRQEKTEKMLELNNYCLLYGAPYSGKSTFVLAFGYYLFKEKGYSVYYLSKTRGGNGVDWGAEVIRYSNEKALYIIDDCHELQEDLVFFIEHIKGVKGPKFLFVSRKSLNLPFKIVKEKIRADDRTFSEIIERCCRYRQIESFEEKIGNCKEVIKNCGNNLFMLKLCLDSWDPEKEKISDVRREKIYNSVYKDYLERDSDIFLPFGALYQFKIRIPFKFIEREGLPLNKLNEFKQKGLISEIFIPNQGLYYALDSALFARLILDSGEYRGILSTSDEYTLKILEKYLEYDRSLRIFQALYQNEGIRIGKKLITSETAIEVMKDFFQRSEDIKVISAQLGVLKGYNIDEHVKEIILPRDTLKHFAEMIYKSPSQDSKSIGLLHELKLFYPKKIEELFEITTDETLKYLSVLDLTQIGKFINVYIREDVYKEFVEKYLVEKLKGSNLKVIREFIYNIGKNETEVRDALVKNTIEKLGEVDLVSKIEKSNLKEIQFLIYNIHNASDDPEFGIEILKKVNLIEILKKVNLIPKIEKSSLNDINMLVYNIEQVGGDLYG